MNQTPPTSPLHSPLPWSLHSSRNVIYGSQDDVAVVIATTTVGSMCEVPKDEERANAEYITLACNHFPALREALAEWATEPLACHIVPQTDAPRPLCQCAICQRTKKARALLSQLQS